MIVDAVAPYSCLPCRAQGVVWDTDHRVAEAWCPACQGVGKGWTELDGDGTMLLWDAWGVLLDAGLDPRWMGLAVQHHRDGARVETWRIYGERLWAAEETLAEAVAEVLRRRDTVAEGEA